MRPNKGKPFAQTTWSEENQRVGKTHSHKRTDARLTLCAWFIDIWCDLSRL